MGSSKNHTISKIVAKAILRITIILIVFPVIIYFTNPELMSQQIFFPNRWAFIFPILLLLIFTILLIPVLREKYGRMEYNWLFSLTGIFVCLYLMLFYTRILAIG